MFVKKNNLIYIGTAILAVLYFLSFCRSCSSTDKRELIKTALINPKYENQIESFELSDSQNSIQLTKNNEKWQVKDNISGLYLPADSKKVNIFTKNLTTIRNMYKISDKINKDNSFVLFNESSFVIKYTMPSGFYQLYFGNQDFSLSTRFLMTDKNTTVYEIDDSLDTFLSTSIQSWAEPYLISQETIGKITPEDIQKAEIITENKILKISDYQKLLDLRHGGVAVSPNLNSTKTAIINIELGNKNSINLEILQTDMENEYLVKSTYKTQNKNQTYYMNISSWTYNKIKEITL